MPRSHTIPLLFGQATPKEPVRFDAPRRPLPLPRLPPQIAYIKYRQIEKNPRFDIIGILVDAQTKNITYSNHLENAFQPKVRTINSNSYSGRWKWKHRNKTIK